MNFPRLARGLWQLEVLILILWLSPPLPSEQITAAIEFTPLPICSLAAAGGPGSFRRASDGALLCSGSATRQTNQHIV